MNSQHSAHLAVFNDTKQVLLVKRKDVPVWVIPGGTGEKGEVPLQNRTARIFGRNRVKYYFKRSTTCCNIHTYKTGRLLNTYLPLLETNCEDLRHFRIK